MNQASIIAIFFVIVVAILIFAIVFSTGKGRAKETFLHCPRCSAVPLVMLGPSKCFDCDKELVNRWCSECKRLQTSDHHVYGFSGSGYAKLGHR